MTAISGEGTGMERDYDFTSAPHASDLASPESVGRSAGERTVARANPRKVETCKVPVVFDPRVSASLVGHLVGAINGASIARKTSFLKDRLGEQLFAQEHPHHRRSVAGARVALADLRRRGRQGEEARDHRRGRADHVAAGLRDRARTRAGHDRPCPSRRVVVAVAGIV